MSPDAPSATSAPPIRSRHNPWLRELRALRGRAAREATGRVFVEGVGLLAEALRRGHTVEALAVAPALLRHPRARALLAELRAAGVPLRECSPEAFGSLSARDRPQGIGAVLRQRWVPLEALAPPPSGPGSPGTAGRAAPPGAPGGPPDSGLSGDRGSPGWVALDAVRYPGNLGTILRTCDAAGAAGVLLVGHTADPYDPQAVRASMGAVFGLPLVRTTFPALLAWAARRGYPLIGTSAGAPTDYRAATYRPPVVLLMGNERSGLSPEQQAACEQVVRIPMAGHCDSLNLAVATGILLYEVRRAAHPPDPAAPRAP